MPLCYPTISKQDEGTKSRGGHVVFFMRSTLVGLFLLLKLL